MHKKDGREVSTEVAVKTMRDGASEEDKIKFFQEAAIMGQFRQPNILGIRGIIMEGDTVSHTHTHTVTQAYTTSALLRQ